MLENDETCEVRRAENERENASFQAVSVKQNVEEIRENCKTKTENEARKEECATRIEEVDDVAHEKSEEQRKSLEKGRLRENMILDSQTNSKK